MEGGTITMRSGVMLCYPFEEKRLAKWPTPYIIQPKLDGVRCRAVLNNAGVYTLLSSEEKEIISCPHINLALNMMEVKPPELDGELYVHGLPFEEIFSRTSRTANLHMNAEDIKFHVFDLVSSQSQAVRTAKIVDLPKIPKEIVRVPYYLAEDLDEVMHYYDVVLEQDYEGIIVRHPYAPYVRKRSTSIMKFKPKKDDYYLIIGWKEEISIHGEPKGRLGALICSGGSGDTFAVGTGFCEEDRRLLWKQKEGLIGKLAHVKYQHITAGRGVPRFPVFVEIIEREPTEVGLRL
jgi:DNA ligase-1